MSTLVDTLRFKGGLYANIHYDQDAEQPYRDDNAVRIVVLHRRYIDPAGGVCGIDPDAVAAWEHENKKNWFSIPLFLYDHSGTIYRAAWSNPFHCRWDSGRVGIIALKRTEWGHGNPSDEDLTHSAQSVADTYTEWANGECYGYVLFDADGSEIDAGWGFIGRDAVDAEAKSALVAHFHAHPSSRQASTRSDTDTSPE